ncbi:MAG: glutamate racemase [Burkholderiaceae bacterium]
MRNTPDSRAVEGGALEKPVVADGPIGVFDSGVGGLSILRHVHAALPHENLLYVADSGFAPYGGKPEEVIVARTLAIAEFLLAQGAKALVVACNTATAAAIKGLRERYPGLLVVGVEPGLKPAAALTKSGTVGVLATERTLSSAKFLLLHEQISSSTGIRFLLQPCIGLADQIEKGELRSAATARLVDGYVAPLIRQGADTLVLGCTHYPFVQPLIAKSAEAHSAAPVALVDTGEAIARQLTRMLQQQGIARDAESQGSLAAFTTGSLSSLENAFARLLKLHPPVAQIAAALPVPQIV